MTPLARTSAAAGKLVSFWNEARLRVDQAKSSSVRPAPGIVPWRAALEDVLKVGYGVQTHSRFVAGAWERLRWRTTPSAGALYPFEVFAVIVGEGSYLWDVEKSRLDPVRPDATDPGRPDGGRLRHRAGELPGSPARHRRPSLAEHEEVPPARLSLLPSRRGPRRHQPSDLHDGPGPRPDPPSAFLPRRRGQASEARRSLPRASGRPLLRQGRAGGRSGAGHRARACRPGAARGEGGPQLGDAQRHPLVRLVHRAPGPPHRREARAGAGGGRPGVPPAAPCRPSRSRRKRGSGAR